MRIHLARWLVTPGRPPLENAGIVTFGGRIVAVDRAAPLRRHYHGEVTDHGDAIICPPLVNAHCHLELSPLDYKLRPALPGPGSFVNWVKHLITLRQTIDEKKWGSAIEDAVFQLLDNGVGVLGDVGNSGHVPLFVERSGDLWPFMGIFFQEIIEPSGNNLPAVLTEDHGRGKERISAGSAPSFLRALSAHAPYTASPSLIRAINQWNMKRRLPFTIHTAESCDETAFLQQGKGPLRDLLEQKGHWPPDWDIPRTSPVKYLDSLGCLHNRTLCIHCVQVNRQDLQLIASRRASVCLCPRSNRFIGVGKAPAGAMNRAGINLALGTDSLASNRKLSIFSEMAALAEDAPDIPPDAILKAATLGGARALGFEQKTGTLDPGKSALFLIVHGQCATAGETIEFLVHQAHKGSVNVALYEG